MAVRTHIPKEDPRLPDSYGVKIFFIGEREPLALEVSAHRIIDKIYQPERKEENGAVIHRLVGPAPVPLFEYETKDDILGTIPLSSIKHLEFDKRWSEIRAISAELEQKERK